MKLVVVINSPLFDASLPLLKRLDKICDLFCLFEVYPQTANQMGISEESFGNRNVIDGTEVASLEKYSDYIPLSKTKIIRFYRPSQLLKHLLMMKYVKKTIEGLKPDFVYFYNVPYPSLYFAYCSRIPWAMAVHDPQLHSGQDHVGYYKIMRKLLFRKCDNFFLFSKNLIAGFSNTYSLPIEKIHLTRLGAYEQLKKQSYQVDDHRGVNLLFFGRINSYKGLRYLLEAFRMLRKNGYLDVSLTILGKGKIEEDIVDLNSEGIRIINKFYTTEEFEAEISDSDIVVCPYTDATQSGVVMSAYAFDKPCLVTEVGGLTEMVTHLINGYVVPPSDANALYNAIVYIYNHKPIIKEWQATIHEQYCDGGEYGWDTIACNLLATINKIINDGNRN
jgi:glycosyltransferase involved in cell wall biosynthesis